MDKILLVCYNKYIKRRRQGDLKPLFDYKQKNHLITNKNKSVALNELFLN